jgi:hypothetical protein
MSASATAQHRPKPVHWFVVHGIAWALLIGLWPTPRAAYPELFHAHANAVFRGLDAWSIHLSAPAPDSGVDTDTVMTGAPRGGDGIGWQSSFSATRIGFWPSALLAALILATPLSPLRRAASVLIGFAVVDLFTLARIGVEIAYADYTLAHATDAQHGPLHVLLRVGSESLTATIPSAAIVLACWVLCASPARTIDLRAARAWIRGRSG